MENRKHTSLKDLAQALGVSIPTGAVPYDDFQGRIQAFAETG